MILGSGFSGPIVIEDRVPDLFGSSHDLVKVEAYDGFRRHCAACRHLEHGTTCPTCSFDLSVPIPPVIFKQSCIFPFEAISNAFHLAAEHGYFHGSQISNSPTTLRTLRNRRRSPETRFVTFSSCASLAFCDEDEICSLEIHHVHLNAVTAWPKRIKPWTLHLNSLQPIVHHFPDQPSDDRSGRFVPRYERTDPIMPVEQNAWMQQPPHVQDLGLAFQEYGNVDAHGNRCIEVLTWYLHGTNLRDNRRPRLVRLGEDFITWTDTIRRAWRDYIQVRTPTHYHVVHPEPPIDERDRQVAQILLVQAPQHFERAVVLSSIYPAPTQIAIQRSARFTVDHVTRQQCIDLAEIPFSVRHRPIRALHGWRPILDPPHPALLVPDGAALNVVIQPPLPETNWNDDDPSGADADRHMRSRSRTPPRGVPDDSDSISLMARQGNRLAVEPPIFMNERAAQDPDLHVDDPHEDVISSSSSDTASTYDSEEPSHFSHLFRLQAPMVAARIRSENWALMLSNIRSVLGLARHDIQQLHVMTQTPPDLRNAKTYVAIVQQHGDIQPGDTSALAIVDIAFHGHHRADFYLHRSAQLIAIPITRHQLLDLLGVLQYCSLPRIRNRCIVRLNGRRLRQQDRALHPVQHADYIQIDLPPHPRIRAPTRFNSQTTS